MSDIKQQELEAVLVSAYNSGLTASQLDKYGLIKRLEQYYIDKYSKVITGEKHCEAEITAEDILSWADGIISAEMTPDQAGKSTDFELELASRITAIQAIRGEGDE